MPIYAECERETGLVRGTVVVPHVWHPLEADLPEGRWMLRDGQIVAAPTVELTAPAEQPVAGELTHLGLRLPEGFESEAPREFTVSVNDQLIQIPFNAALTPDMLVGTFFEAGDYAVKIEGPEPWRSNVVRLTVAPRPDPPEQEPPPGA